MKKFIIPVLSLLIIITGDKVTFPQSSIYENLMKTVNTDDDETSCSFSSDKKTFIFTRKLKKSKNYDLYSTEYRNGKWQAPVPLKTINTDSDEISPCISQDGKFLFFSSNRPGSQKNAKAAKPSFDIYICEKNGAEWSTPYSLFGAVNTSDDETNPYFTTDGKTLYFTRTRFDDGTKSIVIETGRDGELWGVNMQTSDITYLTAIRIYMTRKSVYHKGFWVSAFKESKREIFFIAMDDDGNSEILDPGKNANTPGDENSVYEIDKNLIIVSSNNGLSGSFDVAIKQIPDDFFPAVNQDTVKDDTAIDDVDNTDTDKDDQAVIDNSKKSDSADDIKKKDDKITKENSMDSFVLEIVKEGKEIPASIPLKVLFFNTLKSWSDPVDTKTISTDDSGRLEIGISSKTRRIVVMPDNESVDGFAAEFIINRNGIMTGTLKLTKSNGKKFEFRPVFFNFNSSEIQLQDIPYMHELLEYLRKNSDIKISLEGYSDGNGSYRANMDISLERAERVRYYLINNGIDSSRIRIKGNGFVRKKSKDTSQQHRRVDFLIVQ